MVVAMAMVSAVALATVLVVIGKQNPYLGREHRGSHAPAVFSFLETPMTPVQWIAFFLLVFVPEPCLPEYAPKWLEKALSDVLVKLELDDGQWHSADWWDYGFSRSNKADPFPFGWVVGKFQKNLHVAFMPHVADANDIPWTMAEAQERTVFASGVWALWNQRLKAEGQFNQYDGQFHHAKIEAYLAQVDRHHHANSIIWDAKAALKDNDYLRCRVNLARLKDVLGEESYYAHLWPPPVPVSGQPTPLGHLPKPGPIDQ